MGGVLSPLETVISRICQCSSGGAQALHPGADQQSLPGSAKLFVRSGSPSSLALHGGFVKRIIRHSEETTQLPVPESPREQNCPSVCR